MKKHLYALLIFICSFSFSENTYAAKVYGGELLYEWMGGNTYRFFMKMFLNCSDTSGISPMSICFYNPCDASGFSQPLLRWPSQVEWINPTGCVLQSMCDSFSSPANGFYGFWFYSDVTLPSKCSNWRASTNIGYRENSFNLANAKGEGLYLEARLNNQLDPVNSSPYFDKKPATSFCLNAPITYKFQAVDPDADSISFEVIQPLAGHDLMGCGETPDTLAFRSIAMPFNTTTNPFPTSNTFSLTSSGVMNFTPKYPGVMALAVKVSQYRVGIFVGSIMRDMSFAIPGTPTSVDDMTTVAAPVIYPNPAKNNFTIKGMEGAASVSIVNSLGQLVYKADIQQASSEVVINKHLPAGRYLVKVSGAGASHTLTLAVVE
ncbi:MAG: T9SS type A sorting domain-containing protein [Sphingobacteriales bacterium]|nr:MAG: T9SS type A sorting domain-containing protein [Sphingobacteriales bacterium]